MKLLTYKDIALDLRTVKSFTDLWLGLEGISITSDADLSIRTTMKNLRPYLAVSDRDKPHSFQTLPKCVTLVSPVEFCEIMQRDIGPESKNDAWKNIPVSEILEKVQDMQRRNILTFELARDLLFYPEDKCYHVPNKRDRRKMFDILAALGFSLCRNMVSENDWEYITKTGARISATNVYQKNVYSFSDFLNILLKDVLLITRKNPTKDGDKKQPRARKIDRPSASISHGKRNRGSAISGRTIRTAITVGHLSHKAISLS